MKLRWIGYDSNIPFEDFLSYPFQISDLFGYYWRVADNIQGCPQFQRPGERRGYSNIAVIDSQMSQR